MINDDVEPKGTNASTQMAPDVLLTSRKSTTKDRKKKKKKKKHTHNQQQNDIIYELLNSQGYLSTKLNLFNPILIRWVVRFCLTGRR
jgi:hypothetical protein